MSNFEYPESFIEETGFPVFSEEDIAKIKSLFGYSISANIVDFWKNNSGKKFRKTCVVKKDEEGDEVQGFVQSWMSGAEIEEYLNFIDEQLQDGEDSEADGEQFEQLKENFLPLAEVEYFSRQTLLYGLGGEYEDKIFLLDEERGQGLYEVIEYLEEIADGFKNFTANNLIDFEAEKERENLSW